MYALRVVVFAGRTAASSLRMSLRLMLYVGPAQTLSLLRGLSSLRPLSLISQGLSVLTWTRYCAGDHDLHSRVRSRRLINVSLDHLNRVVEAWGARINVYASDSTSNPAAERRESADACSELPWSRWPTSTAKAFVSVSPGYRTRPWRPWEPESTFMRPSQLGGR